eukprot:441049-Pyramimonas_sp.AAC.1
MAKLISSAIATQLLLKFVNFIALIAQPSPLALVESNTVMGTSTSSSMHIWRHFLSRVAKPREHTRRANVRGLRASAVSLPASITQETNSRRSDPLSRLAAINNPPPLLPVHVHNSKTPQKAPKAPSTPPRRTAAPVLRTTTTATTKC